MDVRKVAITAILLSIVLLGLNTYVPARARPTFPSSVLPENFRGFGGPYLEIQAEVPAENELGYSEALLVVLADFDGPGYRTRTRNMEMIVAAYLWVDESGFHLLTLGLRYDPRIGDFEVDRDMIYRDSGYLSVRPFRRLADVERVRTSIRGIDENSRARFRTYMVCESGPFVLGEALGGSAIYRISLSLWMRGKVYDWDPINGKWVPTDNIERVRVRIRGFDREGGNWFGRWYVQAWAHHYMPGD